MTAADERRCARIRETIDAAKRVPCVDCGGEFEPCQMDLDHRPGETKAPTRRQSFTSWARSVSLDRLRKELKKCDVRCANCHRLKTYLEAQPC